MKHLKKKILLKFSLGQNFRPNTTLIYPDTNYFKTESFPSLDNVGHRETFYQKSNGSASQ